MRHSAVDMLKDCPNPLPLIVWKAFGKHKRVMPTNLFGGQLSPKLDMMNTRGFPAGSSGSQKNSL